MNLTDGDSSLLGLLLIMSYKIWLARDIISYSGRMFLFVFYYIVNFKIINSFCCFLSYLSVICYHTAALPCKLVVNKCL